MYLFGIKASLRTRIKNCQLVSRRARKHQPTVLGGTQLLVLRGEPWFPVERSGLRVIVDFVPEKIWSLELQLVFGLVLQSPLLVVVIAQLWNHDLPRDVRVSDVIRREIA